MKKKRGQAKPQLDLPARFQQSMQQGFADAPPKSLGVAVSGGGDSVALMALLNGWAGARCVQLHAVTVDHGLRDGSAQEAADVAAYCAKLGFSHDVLRWQDWDGVGNLQQAARLARYSLMAEWAKDCGIECIALGHTLDDQGETVLMRLARGSGVDGLSAMSRLRTSDGISWHRPLLGIGRQELREYLRKNDIDWIEDPSNDDETFERVRMRKAMDLLAPLGIDAANLAATANRLASVRQVLGQFAADAAVQIAMVKAGAVFLDTQGLITLAEETRRRLLSHALCWVSHNAYGPRAEGLAELWQRVARGETATLHGCMIFRTKTQVVVARELAAIAGQTCKTGMVWDHKWRVHGPDGTGLHVGVTGGNGLKSCPNWRDSSLPRQVLLATPAIWSGDELVAAPLAGFEQDWRAEPLLGQNDFVQGLLSH